MRIVLSPGVLFFVRTFILLIGMIANEWSYSVDGTVLTFPWWVYALFLLVLLHVYGGEWWQRRRDSAPAVLDVKATLRSVSFWVVLAFVAFYPVLLARIIPFPEPRYTRAIVGSTVWIASLMLAPRGLYRPAENTKSRAYFDWPRLFRRKRA